MNTETELEMKRQEQDRKLYRMVKVHNFLEMWHGSQNLCATQKESRAQNEQLTAVAYISDSEEIRKPSWSNFQHDSAAALKLPERSPFLPASSVKNILVERSQIVIIRRIQ